MNIAQKIIWVLATLGILASLSMNAIQATNIILLAIAAILLMYFFEKWFMGK